MTHAMTKAMTKATMQAVVAHRFGGPEVLRVETVPEPVAGDGESVIDVALAGLNYADLEIRAGTYAPPPLPAIIGADVVGRRRRDGRRVAALLRQGGGYAQVAVARDAYTVEVPDDIDDIQAVALLEQACTAHSALTTVGRLRAGESVAISAAAGGVGHLALQLARAAGATPVIGLASTPAKREFIRTLGADHAVPTPAHLREVLPSGIDLYLDSLGGPDFHSALDALAPFGRLVSIGWRGPAADTVRVDDLAARSVGVHGVWMQRVIDDQALFAHTVDHIFTLAREGGLRAWVDRVVPLSGVRGVHEEMAARRTTGKVLIDAGR